MLKIRCLQRSRTIGIVVLGLGLWSSAPVHATLQAYGVTPPMKTGDNLIIYIINGLTPQNVTVTLYDPTDPSATRTLTTQTAALGASGSASESTLLTWTNSGVPLSHVTIEVDASQYFYDSANGAVLMFITGYDSSGFMSFAVDRQSILTPISHNHGPGGPDDHNHNPDNPTSPTNPFTLTTLQNYPNPFKSSQGTHFIYDLSGATDTTHVHSGATPAATVQTVDIRIWSPSGHLVRSLGVTTNALRGVIAWDGKDHSGKPVATGIYLAEILVNSNLSFSTRLKLAAIGGN
jgi:hypothetical protein